MIYILDHYYVAHHVKECLVLQSLLSVEDLIQLTSALTFYYESIHEDEGLNASCLKKILCSIYEMKDVKKHFLKQLSDIINLVSWETAITAVPYPDAEIIHIDLYEAREMCCGPRHQELITKWITSRGYQTRIHQLCDEYVSSSFSST